MPYFVAQRFCPTITSIAPLGQGLINDTFLVSTPTDCFVLQRINRQVFPEPEHIMANLCQLNQHIQQKTSQLQLPKLLNTRTQQPFFRDDLGDVWRALSFIANSESLTQLDNLDIAAQIGFALGQFHCLVSDLNPALLYDTLPSFHIAPDYLHQYQQVLRQPTVLPEHAGCKAFIDHYQHFTDDLEIAKQQGLLKLRVIHGDPKLDNFLFDKHSSKVLSLIDLDTVKAGLVHYDIADCLRSCCHDKTTDAFSLTICQAILVQYLQETAVFFSEHDYAYLYSAIRLLPFELGLRFYTDYLQGNRYFKVTDAKQNLQRAIAQFRLCISIRQQETALKQLIHQLSA